MGDSIRSQQQAWDDWLARNRIGSQQDPHGASRIRAVMKEVARLPTMGRNNILDVGCGHGDDSVQLARFGRVVATDLSAATIAHASQRHQSSGVRFVAGDFLELSFAEAPFDVVVTLETIAHVYDQPAFVRHCADLLRPGGALVVTTQNKAVYDFLGFKPPSGYLRKWLSRNELIALLRPNFRVERVQTIAPAEPGSIVPASDGRTPPLALRAAYSYRLNAAATRFLPPRWLDSAKERLGVARTLVVTARRL